MSSDTSAPGTAAVLSLGTRVRVTLAGELDLACRPAVEEACGEALSHGLPVDLDVQDVTFMDSSVLTVVFTMARSSPVRVVGPNELVRFLFEVTGLSSRVEMVDEDPEAL